jgi:bla regulator protein BlaR1
MTALLLNHLWQSTLFAGVIAILALALRHNRARLRYGLWLVASAKFLVPFAALAAAGGLLEWQQAPAPIRSAVASPVARDFSAPFAVMWVDPTTMVTSAAQPQWIAPLLFTMWACGFAAIVLRRVRQWREISAAVRTSTPFAATTPVPGGIEIRTAPTVLEPGVVGLRRPVILLPEGIDEYLTAGQLTAVLAHEVCHVRRRDNLTAAMHMLVEALFWFHPMVWWLGARLVATREQACDEHVVAETAEPVAYAEGIVTVCRRYVETPHMAVAGVGGADIKGRIDAILANRVGLRLTLSKRVLLAIAATVTLALPIVTGAIDAAAFAAGQLPGVTAGGPQVDPERRFEVVSIKPFDASGGAAPRSGTRGTRYDFSGLPLWWLVAQAFRAPLDRDRLVGLPEWIDTERYAIAGTIPDGVPVSVLPVLMTNLLKDRFRMVAHTETREMPVYNLVLARNDRRLGPSLKETSAECRAAMVALLAALQRGASPPTAPTASGACPPPGLNIGFLSQGGIEMAILAQGLTQVVGRPVIDRTGLTGYYDYTLKWMPEPGIGPPGPPVDPDAPIVFTAVQEQLGLKLEAARGPVEVVVIDRLEKPTVD